MQAEFIKISGHAAALAGRTFGRLVVIGPVGRDSTRSIIWLCKCSCGNYSRVSATNLLRADSKSCGCFAHERRLEATTTHGLSHTRLYKNFVHIVERCYKLHTSDYHNYGGRGIGVCPEWLDSFKVFYDYVSALPHFGEQGYTLDRIDNDGNYEPGNMRWATNKEQTRNTRVNHMITYNGRTQCLADWAREYGLLDGTLSGRLARGWDIERALTMPVPAKTAQAYGLTITGGTQ